MSAVQFRPGTPNFSTNAKFLGPTAGASGATPAPFRRRRLPRFPLVSRCRLGELRLEARDDRGMRSRSEARNAACMQPCGGVSMSHQQFASCIKACDECAAACEHCASACLSEAMVDKMRDCIRLDLECAAVCRLASRMMASGARFAGDFCALCARICDACGAECAKHEHEHCQACARACRSCAEECRRMAA